MARFIMYAIECSEPRCRERELLVEGEHAMGATVTCEQGHAAVVRPAVPRAIGIIVEYESKQLGRTFRSNREMQDYLNYGAPIKGADGEVVGFEQRRLLSHDEMDASEEQGWRDQEVIARQHGRSLEEDAKFRVEGVKEKIARDVEAGQTPSVKPVTVESLLPA
jgi:hypothetical protein